MRASSLSTVELLRKKKHELLQRVAEIDEDITVIEGMDGATNGPVLLADFLQEKGDFGWVFNGLIAEGTVSMLVAEPRLGKTTLLVQMSLALSAGVNVLGTVVPKPRKVLYILAEGSRHAFRERLRTTCASMGIPETSMNWWVQPDGMADFKLTGSETSRIIRAAKAELVVLDTLGYFSGSDENDSLAWKKNVMAPLRAYCAEFGCAFVINHHPRKSAADGAGNRWEQGRGTSAMFGDVDHYFTMSKVPLKPHEEGLPSIEKSRLEQRREFHVEKSKYSADGWSLQLEFWKPRGTFELGAW